MLVMHRGFSGVIQKAATDTISLLFLAGISSWSVADQSWEQDIMYISSTAVLQQTHSIYILADISGRLAGLFE